MNKIGKIISITLLSLTLTACGCSNSLFTNEITFSCKRDYPVNHDEHLIYQDDYEGTIKDNLINDVVSYSIHLYDNFDSYNEMKKIITENNNSEEDALNTTFDDKNYTIKVKNQGEDNIIKFISDKNNKLYAKDFIKSLEEMEYKCEIKGTKRKNLDLE